MKILFCDENKNLVRKVKKLFEEYDNSFLNIELKAKCGDVFKQKGVIVSASNPSFLMSGGLDAQLMKKYPEQCGGAEEMKQTKNIFFVVSVNSDLAATKQTVKRALARVIYYKRTQRRGTYILTGLGTGIGGLSDDDFISALREIFNNDLTNIEKFGDYNEFGDYGQFGDSNKFGNFNKFGYFNKFGDYNEFSYSNQFGEFNEFGYRNKFGNSNQFGDSNKFGSYNEFGDYNEFDNSNKFGDSNKFKDKNNFDNYSNFGCYNEFSNYNGFGDYNYFGSHNKFGDSNQFVNYNEFDNSNEFGDHNEFDDTNEFGNSNKFGDYSWFGQENRFSNSNEFGVSNRFEALNKFGNYNRFGEFTKFEGHNEFGNSSVFGGSNNFGGHNNFGNSSVFGGFSKFGEDNRFGHFSKFGASPILHLPMIGSSQNLKKFGLICEKEDPTIEDFWKIYSGEKTMVDGKECYVFYKAVKDNYKTRNGVKYKVGTWVTDEKPFAYDGSCVKGGLYFTNRTNAINFDASYTRLLRVAIPCDQEECVVDPDGDKARAKTLYVLEEVLKN